MGNFDFVRVALPALHPDAARAESYLTTDPRSACFYSRRTIEELVRHLFDVIGLAAPYKDDLSARVNDAAFKARTGNGINAKLNLIRKLGNTAVHDPRPNGLVTPGRLFESPYTDHAPTGPDRVFPEPDVEVIYKILRSVRATALPADVA